MSFYSRDFARFSVCVMIPTMTTLIAFVVPGEPSDLRIVCGIVATVTVMGIGLWVLDVITRWRS